MQRYFLKLSEVSGRFRAIDCGHSFLFGPKILTEAFLDGICSPCQVGNIFTLDFVHHALVGVAHEPDNPQLVDSVRYINNTELKAGYPLNSRDFEIRKFPSPSRGGSGWGWVNQEKRRSGNACHGPALDSRGTCLA